MQFNFKIQKYQTQAVDALVKCFEGQQFADKVQYLRDKGIMPQVQKMKWKPVRLMFIQKQCTN